jgi:hypothetical protein
MNNGIVGRGKEQQDIRLPHGCLQLGPTDPRWALGCNGRHKTSPDLFADLDILAEAKAFYLDLYDMDDAPSRRKSNRL